MPGELFGLQLVRPHLGVVLTSGFLGAKLGGSVSTATTRLLTKPYRKADLAREFRAAALVSRRIVNDECGKRPAITTATTRSGQGTPEASCDEIGRIANGPLAAVEGRIARLTHLRDEVRRRIGTCSGGSVADCRIVEALAHLST